MAFHAAFVSDYIRLDCQTAPEINNNYFSIEKGVVRDDWELVKPEAAARNLTSPPN